MVGKAGGPGAGGGGSFRGLLEDRLGRLGRGRRPGGGLRLEAEVRERGADVHAHGALERVVLVGVVEGVGLVQVLVAANVAGGRAHEGVLVVVGGRGRHDLRRDGQGLLKLLGDVAGLGANGHG